MGKQEFFIEMEEAFKAIIAKAHKIIKDACKKSGKKSKDEPLRDKLAKEAGVVLKEMVLAENDLNPLKEKPAGSRSATVKQTKEAHELAKTGMGRKRRSAASDKEGGQTSDPWPDTLTQDKTTKRKDMVDNPLVSKPQEPLAKEAGAVLEEMMLAEDDINPPKKKSAGGKDRPDPGSRDKVCSHRSPTSKARSTPALKPGAPAEETDCDPKSYAYQESIRTNRRLKKLLKNTAAH